MDGGWNLFYVNHFKIVDSLNNNYMLVTKEYLLLNNTKRYSLMKVKLALLLIIR
jgi:hypothetical protein